MLSIIASCFGGCYPLVVVASVEVFVVSQLALAGTRTYSNILKVSRASGRVSLFASNPQFLIGGDALHITRGCVVVEARYLVARRAKFTEVRKQPWHGWRGASTGRT